MSRWQQNVTYMHKLFQNLISLLYTGNIPLKYVIMNNRNYFYLNKSENEIMNYLWVTFCLEEKANAVAWFWLSFAC